MSKTGERDARFIRFYPPIGKQLEDISKAKEQLIKAHQRYMILFKGSSSGLPSSPSFMRAQDFLKDNDDRG